MRKSIGKFATPKFIENLWVLFLALKRKDTPLYAKLAALAALCYTFFPVDIIPDFVPVVGFLDDILDSRKSAL